VIRTPYTSDTLVDTLHRLGDPLRYFTTGISQEDRLLQYLLLLQILHADCFVPAIDIVSHDDRVFPRSRRDGHFDLGVRCSEFGQGVANEGAERWLEA
jgi:hypothetical protein